MYDFVCHEPLKIARSEVSTTQVKHHHQGHTFASQDNEVYRILRASMMIVLAFPTSTIHSFNPPF